MPGQLTAQPLNLILTSASYIVISCGMPKLVPTCLACISMRRTSSRLSQLYSESRLLALTPRRVPPNMPAKDGNRTPLGLLRGSLDLSTHMGLTAKALESSWCVWCVSVCVCAFVCVLCVCVCVFVCVLAFCPQVRFEGLGFLEVLEDLDG